MTSFMPVRPVGAVIAALSGSFFGALGLGSALAWIVGAPGELLRGVAVFGHLLILFVGYKLWAGYAIALFMGGMGRKLIGAVLAALLRRESDFRTAAKGALAELQDPVALGAIVEKIRARTTVFRHAGIGFGAVTGLVVGGFGARAGVFGSVAVFTAGGWCYGYLLSRLAREGYLPLPEEDGA
jgi:hypothetical protein